MKYFSYQHHNYSGHQKLGLPKLSSAKTDFLITAISILLFSFLSSFIAGSLIIHPQNGKAVTDLGVTRLPTLMLDVNSRHINLAITPTGSGTLVSGSHDLVVSTDMPTGYNLSLISTAAEISSLLPSSGTLTSPTPLENNTWGFAINQVSNPTPANTIQNGFDSDYVTPTPNPTSKWANPNTNTIIKNTTEPATQDLTTIYYGAKANMSAKFDTYSNTIIYTAAPNTSDIPAPAITSITPQTGSTNGGTEIQITGTGFTVNNHSTTTEVTIGGQNCIGISISANVPASGQDTIYCTTPAHPIAATVDISVTTLIGTAVSQNVFSYIAPTPAIINPIANHIFDAGTTDVTLSATTDIPSLCFYGTEPNPTTAIPKTTETSYDANITGLKDNSTNTYYIRCQSAHEHSYSPNISVTFFIRAATPDIPELTPANDARVSVGSTVIRLSNPGATCKWGTSSGSYPYSSSTTRTTTAGINTLYYSCTSGSGNTQSLARTGSWKYIGVSPTQDGDPIQNVTKASCPTTITKVYDTRDNHYYAIQKLADGNCWMLTNLAFADNYTGTQFTEGAGIDEATDNWPSDTMWDKTNPPKSRQWVDPTSYRVYQSPTHTKCAVNFRKTADSINYTECGYLYNWCAALGSIATPCSSNTGPPSQNAGLDVCPKGWRLPTGGKYGEYQKLYTALGSSIKNIVGPNSIWKGVFSGAFLPGSGLWGQNAQGEYWTSTANDSKNVFSLFINSKEIAPLEISSKYLGFAIRCVANF